MVVWGSGEQAVSSAMKHRQGNTAIAGRPVQRCTACSLLMVIQLAHLPAIASGAAPVRVPKEILREAPQRVERVFGPATRIREAERNGDRQVLFDPAPWRRLWPDLPGDAEFGITFGPQGEVRAVWLDVNAMVREDRTGVSREFRFGKEEAFTFFHDIFGRNPTRWKEVPLAQGGGGHEGFLDHRFCVDPGVALTFMTYRLGEEWIRLVSDSRCR